MSFRKAFLTVSLIITALSGFGVAARAADSCEVQAKSLSPTIEATTDAAVKEKAVKLQEKAIDEATTEGDEDECLDYLKDLKQVLGVK